MGLYSVHKLARLAGVSVRTLHYYDRLGLLRPSVRTEARYRLYGDQELIRLQQILFYKELDFALDDIRRIMEAPDFDVLVAMQHHKQALETRRDRLTTLLTTIDKTMSKLKGEKTMLTDEELYEGFPTDKAETYRREAVEKYGADVITESEQKLRQLSKADFEQLKADQQDIARQLFLLMNLPPESERVQAQITRHFANIQAFWGPSVCNGNRLEAYKGLAQLYVNDLRYTSQNGQESPEFAAFISRAMAHFVALQLAK